MSKVSKTAKASMGMGVAKEKKVIPDDQLVKMYREGRAAHLWPSLEQSDAVLRTLDTTTNELNMLGAGVDELKTQLAEARLDVEHFQRQLALANSIIESKTKALSDIAAVAGIDPATLAVEPGLTGTQGQDSIGG